MKRWTALGLGATVVIAALIALPIAEWLLSAVGWIQEAGAVGVVALALTYVVVVVVCAPASVLTLGAGFVYGPLWGTLLVSPVSIFGATCAYLLGQTLLRERVARWAEDSPRFDAVDRAIGEQGFYIVFLVRLTPLIPFGVLNYLLALTRVRLVPYVLASWLGALPGTFLYVYLGSTLHSLGEILEGDAPADPATQYLYWGGLLATIAVTVLITRTAKRALDRAVAPPEAA